ncbi:hypothetical protein ANN_04113 [Periplaneta americana]|uniref:Uncharacterized protein n=1 Tax=Periplaneta americana TaxID=6978 RepID=A0ABQ8T7P4_PERAM|nr:hypothetical protein ANN_04113 [Periplaneta americana]
MKEIVNILHNQLKTNDAEIRPISDSQIQKEDEWRTVKHRRNTTEIRKAQQQAIPVIVNRFVLLCENLQISKEKESKEKILELREIRVDPNQDGVKCKY